jgi:hypothetical protein
MPSGRSIHLASCHVLSMLCWRCCPCHLVYSRPRPADPLYHLGLDLARYARLYTLMLAGSRLDRLSAIAAFTTLSAAVGRLGRVQAGDSTFHNVLKRSPAPD